MITNKISLIDNTNNTHKKVLLDSFEKANKVIIAVGFLKQSGLNNFKEHLIKFCSDNSKTIEFYIGTGLAETDPDTLLSLLEIIKPNKNNKLILCTPDAGIFHPKIYTFISGSEVSIVIGSSNLTQHGWEVNDEVSMQIQSNISSAEYLQLEQYTLELKKKYFTEDIKELIDSYKNARKEYLNQNRKRPPFKFRQISSAISEINMPTLKKYYDLYQKSSDFINPVDRETRYNKAKNNLEELASFKHLDPNQFHQLFGPLVGHKNYRPKLWHSGSIHRKTHKTLEYHDSFRAIVRCVKENLSEPVNVAFSNVMQLVSKLRKQKEVSGVGPNIVTEIFLSYDSQKFANLNDNPIAVLAFVGKDFTGKRFTGKDYLEYVNLLKKVREELKMKTFLEIDSFFNYVYWNEIESG
jgi:HKD family nuclease